MLNCSADMQVQTKYATQRGPLLKDAVLCSQDMCVCVCRKELLLEREQASLSALSKGGNISKDKCRNFLRSYRATPAWMTPSPKAQSSRPDLDPLSDPIST